MSGVSSPLSGCRFRLPVLGRERTPAITSRCLLFRDSLLLSPFARVGDEPAVALRTVGAPRADQQDRRSSGVLEATLDFEYFRGWLVEGLGYGDGAKGGRPPFDPVSMFKALIMQTQHNLSDAKMEFMIRDRLSWMRFLKFDLGGPTPDENIIRMFRNKLTETGTLRRVMKAFDWQPQKKGYLPMSGQIVDATLVPAPKQRSTDAEKEAIKAGKSAD